MWHRCIVDSSVKLADRRQFLNVWALSWRRVRGTCTQVDGRHMFFRILCSIFFVSCISAGCFLLSGFRLWLFAFCFCFLLVAFCLLLLVSCLLLLAFSFLSFLLLTFCCQFFAFCFLLPAIS